MERELRWDDLDVGVDDDSCFAKLPDGEQLEGVCRGGIRERYFHWCGHYELCTETPDCPYCEGSRRQVRYVFNFIMRGYCGSMEARILELSPTATAMVKRLLAKNGMNTLVGITRSGRGSETRYVIKALRELTPQELGQIEQIKLHNIDEALGEKYLHIDVRPEDEKYSSKGVSHE